MITNDLATQRAEMDRLRQMTPQAIADEFGKRCPVCGGLIVPHKTVRSILGNDRVTITWPEACCEFEF